MTASLNPHTGPGRDWLIVGVNPARPTKSAAEAAARASRAMARAVDQIVRIDPAPDSMTVLRPLEEFELGQTKTSVVLVEALAAIKDGSANAVMFADSADRVVRRLECDDTVLAECVAAGAFVVSADGANLSDPLMRGVLFGIAARERADRSEHAIHGWQTRRSRLGSKGPTP